MSEISREMLHAYLDDALSDAETARVEEAVRSSDAVRRALLTALEERDRGEHALGAIWRQAVAMLLLHSAPISAAFAALPPDAFAPFTEANQRPDATATNCLGWPETPMRAVGLMDLTAAARSWSGAWRCA